MSLPLRMSLRMHCVYKHHTLRSNQSDLCWPMTPYEKWRQWGQEGGKSSRSTKSSYGKYSFQILENSIFAIHTQTSLISFIDWINKGGGCRIFYLSRRWQPTSSPIIIIILNKQHAREQVVQWQNRRTYGVAIPGDSTSRKEYIWKTRSDFHALRRARKT